LGRWATGDPIGIGDGVNRYAYCRGNPVDTVDHAGTSGVEVTFGYGRGWTQRADGSRTESVYAEVGVAAFGVELSLEVTLQSTPEPAVASLPGTRDAVGIGGSASESEAWIQAMSHAPPEEPELGWQWYEDEERAAKQRQIDRLYGIYETWAHPDAYRPENVPSGAQLEFSSVGDILWRAPDPRTAGDLDDIFDGYGRLVTRQAHGLEAPEVDPYDVASLGRFAVVGVVRRVGLPLWVNGRSAKAIHDEYLQYVRPGAREQGYRFEWTSKSGLGSRRLDDVQRIDGVRIGFEANTTPWARMTREKLAQKLDQVSADWELVASKRLGRVIWFGTEPLPTTGLGGQLRAALEQAGIPYWVVPWP
jgi:hypothetical protein